MIKIAPSILSADFSMLRNEIERLEKAGADLLHIDVMDGHFVPNLTIGPPVIKSIRKCSGLVFDVHLMIENPQQYIDSYANAGADIITVHVESKGNINDTIKMIKSFGKRAAVSLNPDTPVSAIEDILPELDMVLLMSVYPGFGGQKYIGHVTDKISELRGIIVEKGLSIDIEVDGGITAENVGEVVRAGANIIVAGSYIFNAPDMEAAIKTLRDNAK